MLIKYFLRNEMKEYSQEDLKYMIKNIPNFSKLTAVKQAEMFGFPIFGRKKIIHAHGGIYLRVSAGFGQDYDDTFYSWNDIRNAINKKIKLK